ncbi:Dihydropyrimidinase [Dirofilaria immitis]
MIINTKKHRITFPLPGPTSRPDPASRDTKTWYQGDLLTESGRDNWLNCSKILDRENFTLSDLSLDIVEFEMAAIFHHIY